MILKLQKFQDSCKKILDAVDSNGLSVVSETLELVTKGDKLLLNVTNKEYYARVILDLEAPEELHAVVDAKLFLNLISKSTTEDIELLVDKNTLIVKSNGTYKLPMIYDNANLIVLPEIVVENEEVSLEIPSDVLLSIYNYNTKQLSLGNAIKAVQKMYYLDENGCITFTNGACVNNFTLDKPVKVLLSQKLVKLFKLFGNDKVSFTLGHSVVGSVVQTRVKFEGSGISISSLLVGDDLIGSVPVAPIRARANKDYAYTVVLEREALTQAISRLLLFSQLGKSELIKPYSTFNFTKNGLVIGSVNGDNNETIDYTGEFTLGEDYSAVFDLLDIKGVLDNCQESHLTFKFGDNSALVVTRTLQCGSTIKNVIPENRVINS